MIPLNFTKNIFAPAPFLLLSYLFILLKKCFLN